MKTQGFRPSHYEFVHGVVFVPIHTIVIQIVQYAFVHGVVFVPIQIIFYTNCIVRIHTICLRKPRGINLAIRNDPLAVLYEFVSRIRIKQSDRRNHLSPKKLDSPICPGMWEHVQLCTKKFQPPSEKADYTISFALLCVRAGCIKKYHSRWYF